MQTTYDAGQKVKTLHLTDTGMTTVYHDSLDQAVKFSGDFADSYVCLHQKRGSNWVEKFKDQRGDPSRSRPFKSLKLN